MLKKFGGLAVLVMFSLVLAVAGCQTGFTAINSSTAENTVTEPAAQVADATATPHDDAPRISLTDAKAAFDAGTAVFVDSRADAAYKAERIKGAINMHGGNIDAKIKELPKDKKIIVYCS